MILPDACRVNIQPARKACSINAESLLNLSGIHAQFRRFGCAFSAEYALSDRSERSSTIVTTNLPFSKWTELFENTTMVSALVDRLTYRSHVLDMNGPSYRLMSTREEAAAK